MAIDRRLNAGRQRRALAQLDRALAKQGVKPRRPPAKASPATVERRVRAAQEAASARRGYDQLRRAIQANGGISPNRDYPASEIPRELRAKRGRGLAPDEMASVLASEGFHYDGDVAMFTDIERRREQRAGAAERTRTSSRAKNPQVICADLARDERGRFVRRSR